MKQLTLSLLIILGIFSSTFAQKDSLNKGLNINGWRLSSVGLNIGVNFDNYSQLKIQQMKQIAIDPKIVERDLSQYTETGYPNTSAPNFNLSFGFTKAISKDKTAKTVFFDSEIIIDLGTTVAKESYMEYNQEIHYSLDSSRIKSLGYCNLENELTFGASYLLKMHYKRFSVFTGLGGNLGTTYANRFMFWEDEYLSYRKIGQNSNGDYTFDETIRVKEVYENIEAVNSLYTRIFIPFGISCNVYRNFSLNLAGRIGKGYQKGNNQEDLTIKSTGNMNLGAKYRF